jgi:hypothetical protein
MVACALATGGFAAILAHHLLLMSRLITSTLLIQCSCSCVLRVRAEPFLNLSLVLAVPLGTKFLGCSRPFRRCPALPRRGLSSASWPVLTQFLLVGGVLLTSVAAGYANLHCSAWVCVVEQKVLTHVSFDEGASALSLCDIESKLTLGMSTHHDRAIRAPHGVRWVPLRSDLGRPWFLRSASALCLVYLTSLLSAVCPFLRTAVTSLCAWQALTDLLTVFSSAFTSRLLVQPVCFRTLPIAPLCQLNLLFWASYLSARLLYCVCSHLVLILIYFYFRNRSRVHYGSGDLLH